MNVLILQGVAFSCLFIPLTTIALSSIPRHRLPDATGLNSLLRQVGGSIGLAIIATLMSRFATRARGAMLANLSMDRTAVAARVGGMQRMLAGRGMPGAAAQSTAAQILDRPEHWSTEAFHRAERKLRALQGQTYSGSQAKLLELAATVPADEHDLLLMVADVLRLATRGDHATHVMVGGVANLADEAQTWRRETLRRLFETLEREQEMLQVLHDVAADDVSVTIGAEHPTTGEWEASIVTAPFRVGDVNLGTIGIVGPTRMDYLSAMASVRAVAERLSEAATELEQ